MDNNTYSNIITPPDSPTEQYHSVLLIDPEWSELEDLTLFLKTSSTSYNVYLYKEEMQDEEWLDKIVKVADAVIVNTVQNEFSTTKDKIANASATYYYGNKNFLMNTNKLSKPIDYFVGHNLLQGEKETHVVL